MWKLVYVFSLSILRFESSFILKGFFVFIFYYCAGWHNIVAFTKVLTLYHT
jgi:hypothetical protein